MDFKRRVAMKLDSGVNFPTITDEEQQILTNYFELDTGLKEIWQLFTIFKYNLDAMLAEYEFKVNGLKSYKKRSYDENFAAINALIINYISSAKTLLEAMENVDKNTDYHTIERKKKESDFKRKHLSKYYDSNFYYRFFDMLRNFSQHGHPPVSLIENGAKFDLEQIVDISHFNNKHSQEMKKIIEEIHEKYNANADISIAISISEYNICLFEAYNKFWRYMEERTKILSKQVKLLIKEFTVVKDNQGSFACYIYGGEPHAIPIDSFEIDFVVEQKRTSKIYYDKELLVLEEFRGEWKQRKNRKVNH